MAKNVNIQPLSDRVVIKALVKEEVSISGIIIPDTIKKEKAESGTVVAVGPGRYEDGALVPMSVSKGDEVIFQRPYGEPTKLDGEEYYILSEASILAIIPKK